MWCTSSLAFMSRPLYKHHWQRCWSLSLICLLFSVHDQDDRIRTASWSALSLFGLRFVLRGHAYPRLWILPQCGHAFFKRTTPRRIKNPTPAKTIIPAQGDSNQKAGVTGSAQKKGLGIRYDRGVVLPPRCSYDTNIPHKTVHYVRTFTLKFFFADPEEIQNAQYACWIGCLA